MIRSEKRIDPLLQQKHEKFDKHAAVKRNIYWQLMYLCINWLYFTGQTLISMVTFGLIMSVTLKMAIP